MNTTAVQNEKLARTGLREAPVAGLTAYVSEAFRSFNRALTEWQDRIEYRRHLLELDDRLLRDIGLSRYDAIREAAKPFWRQ